MIREEAWQCDPLCSQPCCWRPLFYPLRILPWALRPAWAQGSTPTGARPGNVIGTGESLPRGTVASNIGAADTRTSIAPNLPGPMVAPDAGAGAYLQAAPRALRHGKTGLAQQSLEMAETRLLDRSVPLGRADVPDRAPSVAAIDTALGDLARHDITGAEHAARRALWESREAFLEPETWQPGFMWSVS